MRRGLPVRMFMIAASTVTSVVTVGFVSAGAVAAAAPGGTSDTNRTAFFGFIKIPDGNSDHDDQNSLP